MFSFFRGKKNDADVISTMRKYADKISSNISNTLGENDPFVEVESLIYLYTITDYWFMMDDKTREVRTELFKSVDRILQNEGGWIGPRCSNEKIKQVFDDRINNYFKLLEKNNKKMDIEYFKASVDYQVQLISNIIINKEFSFYNAAPKSPREYSPMITDFLVISQIKPVLIENMEVILNYIKVIRGI